MEWSRVVSPTTPTSGNEMLAYWQDLSSKLPTSMISGCLLPMERNIWKLETDQSERKRYVWWLFSLTLISLRIWFRQENKRNITGSNDLMLSSKTIGMIIKCVRNPFPLVVVLDITSTNCYWNKLWRLQIHLFWNNGAPAFFSRSIK